MKMVEIEIDGEKIKAEPGSSLLQVALDSGKPIPHFCYHKKLSITASCRMCLVEVDRMNKLVPACATPVAEGMVVHTDSEKVIEARKSVMEFLLINHPLDCPVCDQGGECLLQDYSVGYGAGKARFTEEKRIVFVKNVGPLISMQEMSRCIQCTRCIRFGEEIGGLMEFGMVNRGDREEITTFPKTWVNSELSGNMIDVCPVGALTSKPFRYKARGWELSSHRMISPHDGLGSNLNVQSLRARVMRVLPFENEAVNECWLSDRDRFSYEALNSDERLTVPMVKQDNRWIETDWETALNYVAHGLKSISRDHGAASLAALASPQTTLEELVLLQKLIRKMGSEKIEFRLRQSDFTLDGKIVPWLGMNVEEVDKLDNVLIVGSFLRQEAPLLATRFRKAASVGATISMLHALDDDWLMPVENRLIGSPARWVSMMGEIISVVATGKGLPVPRWTGNPVVSVSARRIAESLLDKGNKAILLGAVALQHEQASALHMAAEWLAQLTGARLGYLTEGANATGGYLASAYPTPGSGVTMNEIASGSTKAFLLLQTEPELDVANQPKMMAALEQAEMVVALTPFRQSLDVADVLLPVSPFTETSGTFVNVEGRVQSFEAAVAPLGETRPAWKVLRVLGNFLDLPGFDYDSSGQVRDECLHNRNIPDELNNISGLSLQFQASETTAIQTGLSRITDVPLYFSDMLVRRAAALQQTQAAAEPVVHLPVTLFEKLGLNEKDKVLVRQETGEAVLSAVKDITLPDNVVRLATGHPATAMLGPINGWIGVGRL